MISPFLNKQRSVKFSRNISPYQNNQVNTENNISFKADNKHLNRNLKLFKTTIKDDKIYF